MKTSPAFLALVALGLSATLPAIAAESVARTYRVEQTVTLNEIPADADHVKWWISIPDDERHQELLDFSVTSAPGDWRFVREPSQGNRFMLLEIDRPETDSLTATVAFTLRRQPVMVNIDPALAGEITPSLAELFADELRKDAPHMEATKEISAKAAWACAGINGVAQRARRLLDEVADTANHYSIDPTKPSCSIGDASACMTAGGGCCTDMHSLFIAMARSQGIPARLQMGYRLREPNAGKKANPGYRCWAEYFVPGYGWVPADIVEADDPDGLGRNRWFSGLTERRLWLNTGRDFILPGQAAKEPISTMVIGYAEIDGVPVRTLPDEEAGLDAQLVREVFYTEIAPAQMMAANAQP